jgi:hypothetical protein
MRGKLIPLRLNELFGVVNFRHNAEGANWFQADCFFISIIQLFLIFNLDAERPN